MLRLLVCLVVILSFSLPGSGDVRRSTDEWNVSIGRTDDLETSARELIRLRSTSARAIANDLRSEGVTESLAGRHVFLREYLDGHSVLNGGFAMTTDLDGSISSFHDRRSIATDPTLKLTAADAQHIVLASGERTSVGSPRLVGWIHDDGVARLAWRVVTRSGYDEWATLVDAAGGSIIQSEPLFLAVEGRIFDPNPVTVLNQPALRDNDDSADAVPDSAYTTASLLDLESSDGLTGPHVTITDIEAPLTNHAKPVSGLDFDRSADEFEEVMAYVHIDRSQRYMQSLGFTGSKAIVPYSLPVDVHGVGGEDNSFYRFTTPGTGRLVFGDGGVDDAEDADIILHEYGHAIQDSIVPAGFTGPAASEARALGEGFGDYWAFSSSYAANVSSGADPFCVGNWDALCGEGPSTNCAYPPEATCLRRVDGTKTMADYISSGGQGAEHRNGEIWSSALREVFVDAVAMSGTDEGRRLADRTVLESHFGMPPAPTFRTAAIRLLDADRRLNAGLLESSICRAMTMREILVDDDCYSGLRGEVTMIQSPARGTTIPDNQPAGVSTSLTIADSRAIEAIFVAVDVRHPRRGDLRLSLTGPDGTTVVIQTQSVDSAADLITTYGLDAQPAQPLTPFLGKSAAGTWTLNVADKFGEAEGELRSWSLLLRFAGDEPLTERGRPGSPRLHLAVTGTTIGSSGTKFVSDVRILNTGESDSVAMLLYTPSGANGLETWFALSLEIPPGQIVALDDVVASAFRSSGTGSIEIRGNPALLITSRIYNDQPEGTYGQFLAASGTAGGVTAGEGPLHVIQLRNDSAFRSNVGFAETDGGSGDVEIRFFNGDGVQIAMETYSITPFGHLQFPALGGIGGSSVDTARAEIRVINGDARVIAYGSSVDNLSGDAVLIPGTTLPRPAEAIVVPAAIHAEGAENTNWRSDLWIFNDGTAPIDLDLAWQPSSGGAGNSVRVSLAAGELRRIDDVVSGTFATDGTGSIVVSGADLSSVIVTSRAWNDAPSGSFGQFIEALPSSRAIGIGRSVDLTHLDSNATFRTNIGLTEVDHESVSTSVTVVDSAGEELFSTILDLAPGQNRQVNLALEGVPTSENIRVRIHVLSGSGRILAYASVVDNRTGDAIYIPAH